jgi:hypothetical protein
VAKVISGLGPTPPINPPILPPVIEPPPAVVLSGLGAPTGTVPRGKIGGGGSWDLVNRFDPIFIKEGKKHNVSPAMLKSMMIVETGGKNVSDGHGATGVMQIKPAFWADRARQAGYDLNTDAGQIGMAAAILGGSVPGVRGTTPTERFLYTYYPILNPDGSVCYTCKGESGHTPQMYLDDIALYTKLINDALLPIIINPPPLEDPLEALFGAGNRPKVFFDFLSVGGVGYPYGVGHGTTNANQHTGNDIDVPFGTKFYAPAAGKILCVGENGTGVWGQGCGFFRDTGHGGTDAPSVGVGNITLLCDTGHKFVFGHARTCNFKPGQRVNKGDWIGTTGGMLGPHMHLEAAIDGPDRVSASERARGLTYWLVNPLPAIKAAMGQPGVITKPVVPISHIIWEGTQNFHDRTGQAPVAIFFHVTDDLNFTNVKNHFQNPRSKASAHFVVTENGEKHQFVISGKAAWTNGIINHPRTDIRWLNAALRSGRNFNDFTLNIESMGKPGQPFEPAQIDAVIEIARYYVATNSGILLNRGHFNRHADVDSVDRPYCPSNSFPLAEIIQECGGDPLMLNP